MIFSFLFALLSFAVAADSEDEAFTERPEYEFGEEDEFDPGFFANDESERCCAADIEDDSEIEGEARHEVRAGCSTR